MASSSALTGVIYVTSFRAAIDDEWSWQRVAFERWHAMDIGSTDTVKNATPPPRNPGTNPGTASPEPVKKFDNERAKAVADAEATIAHIDQQPADADNVDEPDTQARAMDVVCAHTEPCASNIELMHRDKEAGMSDAEGLNRGMARLTIFAETLALPTPGPSGPIATGAGGGPSGMPRNIPATDPAIPARREPSVSQRPKPLETTGGGGSKGPGPGDQPAAVADEAVPDAIDDAPTNPVPRKPPEQVGEYRIDGKKSFDPETKIFSREIEGLYRDRGPTNDIRPIRDLFDRFRAEAKQNGAHELQITGKIVRNKNIMRMKAVIEQGLGGKVEKIDAQTIVFTVPIL